ncbi:hypothetical protein TcasGA2_TC033451 [Tribolium castaneum]|uniref:Uncharacterized protein n=1 Tax=Tribolium castaneum TaxID=7070 RepID=A0A139WGC2_TRICA|nr:hypothetical protein TcasGA2_TC033451 [Tribolium castaneum]
MVANNNSNISQSGKKKVVFGRSSCFFFDWYMDGEGRRSPVGRSKTSCHINNERRAATTCPRRLPPYTCILYRTRVNTGPAH